MQTSQPKGEMISVGLSEAQVKPYIDQLAEESGACRLSVACVNSPKNVTLSGDADQIDALEYKLKSEDIFVRKLVVGVAYHSYHMQAIAHDYGLSMRDLEKGTPSSDAIMISSITGQRVTEDQLCKSEYWVENALSQVKFSSAMEQLCSQTSKNFHRKLDCSHRNHPQVSILLEIGPHSALQGPIRDVLSEIPGGANIKYTSALIRGRSSLQSILDCCGKLHCFGYLIYQSTHSTIHENIGTRAELADGIDFINNLN